MKEHLIEIVVDDDELYSITEETTCDICWYFRVMFSKIKRCFTRKEREIILIVSELNTPSYEYFKD